MTTYPAPEDISYDEDSRWCQDHGHTGLLAGCGICDRLTAGDARFAAALSTATPPGPHNPDGSLAGAWWVVCIEHASGPLPGEAAARSRMADIMLSSPFGPGCPRDHHLVRSDTEPDPSYPPDGQPPVLPATN